MNDSRFSTLMANITANPLTLDPESKEDAIFEMIKRAKHVSKQAVGQEFPGLVSIGVLPHFMLPTMVFYHEPTGLLVRCGTALLPGISSLGPEWMTVPGVVRYLVTEPFSEAAVIDALRATYMQSIVVAGFTEEQVRTGSVPMSVLICDASDQTEIAPGVMEAYLLINFKAGRAAHDAAIDVMRSIVSKVDSERDSADPDN